MLSWLCYHSAYFGGINILSRERKVHVSKHGGLRFRNTFIVIVALALQTWGVSPWLTLAVQLTGDPFGTAVLWNHLLDKIFAWPN
jgi:hypothetical protein